MNYTIMSEEELVGLRPVIEQILSQFDQQKQDAIVAVMASIYATSCGVEGYSKPEMLRHMSNLYDFGKKKAIEIN